MNNYIEDSKIFFRTAAKGVSKRMDKATLIASTMSFALAMERVLKGILFDVNPLYVLMKPEFKNSVVVLYKERIVNHTAEATSFPDADVITFRNSLLRAEVVSAFIKNNRSLLFFLSECRDIIAHNELSILDLKKIEQLMQRDFFQISQQFSALYGFTIRDLLANQENKLSILSASLQETIKDKVETILINHMSKWGVLKNTIGYTADKDKITQEILRTQGKVQCSCPACDNKAIIYTRLETDIQADPTKPVIVGAFIKKLKCLYCKLEVDEYDEIEYLTKKFNLQELVDIQYGLEARLQIE